MAAIPGLQDSLKPASASRLAARLRLAVPPHVLVAASGWLSRVASAAIQLISVRLLLQNLGVENYAVFALLAGLQGWFLLADFGVGVSTQNYISEARANAESPASILRAGRLLAIALLLLTIALLYGLSAYAAPVLLRSFPALALPEKTQLFFISGTLAIGFGIGSIVYKVWYAEQRGYLSNIVPTLASALGLAGISAAHWVPADLRLLFALVVFVGPTAALPLGVLVFQTWRAPPLAGTSINAAQWWMIGKRALAFWSFAVLAALTLQVDYIVISQFLKADDIAIYTLSTKIFGLAFFVYNAMIMALWPIFSELIAKRDWTKVRRFLQKYLAAGMAYMTVCTAAMIWLMPFAIGLLAPRQHLVVPVALTITMGIYQVVRVWTDTFSMLLQSMSKLRPFWLFVPFQAALSGTLQWFLAPRFGLIGIVTGLMLSFLLTVTWGLPLAARRYSISLPPSGA